MVSVGFPVDISGITSRHDEVQFMLFCALKIFQILLGNNFRSKLRVQLIDESVFELQFFKILAIPIFFISFYCNGTGQSFYAE